MLPKNPLEKYTRPKVEEPDINPPTAEDIKKLLVAVQARRDATQNPLMKYQPTNDCAYFAARDYALYCILITTGCRIGEACNLKLNDILIEKTGSKQQGTLTFKHTKNKTNRTVPITHNCIVAMQDWYKIRLAKEHAKEDALEKLKIKRTPILETIATIADTFFLNNVGLALTPDAFYECHQGYIKFAKITPFRIHDFRHYTLTLLSSDLRAAQLIAGHSQLETTIQRYDHADFDRIRAHHAAVDPLGTILSPVAQTVKAKRHRIT